MTSIAILVANSHHKNLSSLECCHEDVLAMKELLDATEKYTGIEIIENAEASLLKDGIRDFVDKHSSVDEVFFYFTGHGFQKDFEFYFCATNFEFLRPNETGLSNSDLHILLKVSKADLIVKVVDACSSGALLVKSDAGFLPVQKDGFKNLIQIASCLDSQNSLTGDPLSLFTEKFRAATLRKMAGPVYYTDIVDTLRDEFLNNNSQTPHFVSQGTGREQFVENANLLAALREKVNAMLAPPRQEQIVSQDDRSVATLLHLLQAAENRMAKKDSAQEFIGSFFDNLTKRLSTEEFSEFFTFDLVEHYAFIEPTTRDFIIRVMAKESRPDNFVVAKIEPKRRGPIDIVAIMGYNHDDFTYDLQLNCSLERVQLKITLTPKYQSLKRIVLVVTCAPSLEICYVFELVTQHSLEDWEQYESGGQEVTRRWYKMAWIDNTDGLIEKISKGLSEIVRQHVEGIAQNIAK